MIFRFLTFSFKLRPYARNPTEYLTTKGEFTFISRNNNPEMIKCDFTNYY